MLLLAFRIGLLVLLWVFILLALRTLRNDMRGAAPAAAAPASKSSGPVGKLQIVDGPLAGSYLPLAQLSEVVMGRSSQCTLTLPDDYASARHARLFRRGSEWLVEDLDSRNGTVVAGSRIDQPERVSAGSEMKIGRTTVRLMP